MLPCLDQLAVIYFVWAYYVSAIFVMVYLVLFVVSTMAQHSSTHIYLIRYANTVLVENEQCRFFVRNREPI